MSTTTNTGNCKIVTYTLCKCNGKQKNTKSYSVDCKSIEPKFDGMGGDLSAIVEWEKSGLYCDDCQKYTATLFVAYRR